MTNSFDEQLVSLMAKNARQNSETMAKQLNKSSATVRRRLRKLIRSDLLRIVGVVDPAKFGFPLVAVIALDINHENLESAMEWLVNQPEIKWVSTTTGRFDVMAIAQFRSTDGLSDFLAKKLGPMEGLRDSETLVCLNVRKGRYVPLV